MHKNKAPIAQDSIKNPWELPGPFSGPWTQAVRNIGLPPPTPPPPNENSGLAHGEKFS